MNILTFLTEGRGFTYQNKFYITGGSKKEKKYYCDEKEISQQEYEKALEAHRQKKSPLIKKAAQTPPQPSTPLKRMNDLIEHFRKHPFVPSEKEGEEGAKENLERISKMLNLSYGIQTNGLRPEGVKCFCQTLANMARDFPCIYDEVSDGALQFVGTIDGFGSMVHNFSKNYEKTIHFKKAYKKLEEIADIRLNGLHRFLIDYNEFAPITRDRVDTTEFFNRLLPNFNIEEEYLKTRDNDEAKAKFIKKLESALKRKGIKFYSFDGINMEEGFLSMAHKLVSKIFEKKENLSAIRKLYINASEIKSAYKHIYDHLETNYMDMRIQRESAGGICYNAWIGNGKFVVLTEKYSGSEDNEEFDKNGIGDGIITGNGFHNNILKGNAAESGMNHILAHELAHVLHARINKVLNPKDRQEDFDKPIKLETPIKIGSETYSEIITPHLFFEEVFKQLGSEKIKKEISGYAATSPEEMVAEAFALAYCTKNPPELAKQIFDVLKILAKENIEHESKLGDSEYLAQVKKERLEARARKYMKEAESVSEEYFDELSKIIDKMEESEFYYMDFSRKAGELVSKIAKSYTKDKLEKYTFMKYDETEDEAYENYDKIKEILEDMGLDTSEIYFDLYFNPRQFGSTARFMDIAYGLMRKKENLDLLKKYFKIGYVKEQMEYTV